MAYYQMMQLLLKTYDGPLFTARVYINVNKNVGDFFNDSHGRVTLFNV